MKPKADVLRSLQLPSRRIVSVEFARPTSPFRRRAKAPIFSEVLEAERHGLVQLSSNGQALPIDQLALIDFHAVRAIAMHEQVIEEVELALACKNCGKRLLHRPCRAMALAPFFDHELNDSELDQTLDLNVPHRIKSFAFRGTAIDQVKFAQVNVAGAGPLYRALRRRELEFKPAIVESMGIERLGELTAPGEIADALSSCAASEARDTIASITDLFLRAHYSLRLFSIAHCESCGARNDVDAPYEREFEPSFVLESNARAALVSSKGQTAQSNRDSFVSFDEFDRHACDVANELFGTDIEDISLVVDGEIPHCDEGGEPLLGSYVPAFAGDMQMPAKSAEITLYYRTFRAVWDEEGPYDWKSEVYETVEHELEHHFAYLRGHDPTDEAERDEIAREQERVFGKKELARTAVRALGLDFAEFVRRTWIIWLLIFAIGSLYLCSGEQPGP